MVRIHSLTLSLDGVGSDTRSIRRPRVQIPQDFNPLYGTMARALGFPGDQRWVQFPLKRVFGDALMSIDAAMAIKTMPRYQCHKKVWALKIKSVIKHAHPDPQADDAAFEASDKFAGAHLFPAEEGYAPIPVDADWYRKHKPQPGGYYIIYDDGYASYSPAKAFEDGYTKLT